MANRLTDAQITGIAAAIVQAAPIIAQMNADAAVERWDFTGDEPAPAPAPHPPLLCDICQQPIAVGTTVAGFDDHVAHAGCFIRAEWHREATRERLVLVSAYERYVRRVERDGYTPMDLRDWLAFNGCDETRQGGLS